ncbi:hypothetical protein OKW50_003352 [Paraburkholderia youngii]
MRLQQRSEIMENFHRIVNRFLSLAYPAHAAEALANKGFPPLRAPASGARKSGILVATIATCKRYFDKCINDV